MVSIVLVTYNRAARLRLSIQDILNQTFTDFELIICDDCSTDGTEGVCRYFAEQDERIKYFRHASNKQMPENCNFGIRQAKYDYVAILHDGDRFRPNLIERWYNAISSNDTVGFVFNSNGLTDANENIIHRYREFDEGIISKEHLLKDVFFKRWQFDSPVYGEAMVRKNLLVDHGYLHQEFGFYADVNLWMDLLHSHDAYYCAETLITGPTKVIQPRLFEYNIIRVFLYLFNMHLRHRHKAFRKNPLRLVGELTFFWGQSLLNVTYHLILIVKNFSFRYFISAAKVLQESMLFLIPWIVILFLYPILFPFLKLYGFIKNNIPKQSQSELSTSQR